MIILLGRPGTGKTLLMSKICDELSNKKNIEIDQLNATSLPSIYNFNAKYKKIKYNLI